MADRQRVADKATVAESVVGDTDDVADTRGPAEMSDEDDGLPAPAMPVVDYRYRPRSIGIRIRMFSRATSAAVARPVNKAEVRRTLGLAQKALRKEWDRLRKIGCWHESVARARGPAWQRRPATGTQAPSRGSPSRTVRLKRTASFRRTTS